MRLTKLRKPSMSAEASFGSTASTSSPTGHPATPPPSTSPHYRRRGDGLSDGCFVALWTSTGSQVSGRGEEPASPRPPPGTECRRPSACRSRRRGARAPADGEQHDTAERDERHRGSRAQRRIAPVE